MFVPVINRLLRLLPSSLVSHTAMEPMGLSVLVQGGCYLQQKLLELAHIISAHPRSHLRSIPMLASNPLWLVARRNPPAVGPCSAPHGKMGQKCQECNACGIPTKERWKLGNKYFNFLTKLVEKFWGVVHTISQRRASTVGLSPNCPLR